MTHPLDRIRRCGKLDGLAVYPASRDLFLAQRFARHASPLTTVIYTHVSDEEMFVRLRDLAC